MAKAAQAAMVAMLLVSGRRYALVIFASSWKSLQATSGVAACVSSLVSSLSHCIHPLSMDTRNCTFRSSR